VTPILTVVVCAYILSGLPAVTWVIFGTWLLIVLAFYFAWGRRHALLNDPQHATGPKLGEGE
jgi:hypothetical protein